MSTSRETAKSGQMSVNPQGRNDSNSSQTGTSEVVCATNLDGTAGNEPERATVDIPQHSAIAGSPGNARSNASSIAVSNARTDVTDGRTDGDPTHPGEIEDSFVTRAMKADVSDEVGDDTSAAPKRNARCDTHGVSLPCAGCRADELVNPAPKPSEPDGRMRAAGER